jgi:hypothetical protein
MAGCLTLPTPQKKSRNHLAVVFTASAATTTNNQKAPDPKSGFTLRGVLEARDMTGGSTAQRTAI